MIIKHGFDDKPTHLRFDGSAGSLRLFIEQEGVPTYGRKRDEEEELYIRYDDSHSETLAYLSIEEAVILRDELNNFLREVLGL